MSFVINTAKTIRNNWKKSTFALVVVTYGGIRTKRYIQTKELMRDYCEKAAEYGKQTVPVHDNPRSVTVILNPNANKRKATDDFETYCAPLLHLAGIFVNVIKTDSEGHAKTLMETLNAEAIVVAGGDGTLSEVVTGLLRRTNDNSQGLVPIGVLPLGRNSTVAKTMFPGDKHVDRVKSLADATMAVIEEVTRPADVMKIEVIGDDDTSEPPRPVYAVAGIKWGAFRDAEMKKDDYWYFGSLRNYMTYLFSGAKSNLTWNCVASINYSPPCQGCSNCYKVKQNKPSSRWFQGFIKEDDTQRKYLSITNPDCQKVLNKKISTSDLALLTSNAIPESVKSVEEIPKLQLRIGPDPENVHYVDFVRQGWQSVNGKERVAKEIIEAKTIEINPEKNQNATWFSIDNENFEVRPIRITLLPKIINMYCKKENALVNT